MLKDLLKVIEETPTATIYDKSKPTSAAEREGAPGQYAYGRSLPSPVQSIDAATVAQTVTGKSHGRN